MRYRPPAAAPTSEARADAPRPQPRVLDRVRGNSCIGWEWTAYQNQLLADGRYTYEQLFHMREPRLFEAWEQAHEEDRLFNARKAQAL